jgi:hypothetical protein
VSGFDRQLPLREEEASRLPRLPFAFASRRTGSVRRATGDDWTLWWKPLASVREHANGEKASHRGHGGHRGGIGVGDQRALVDTVGFRARTRQWGNIAQKSRRTHLIYTLARRSVLI